MPQTIHVVQCYSCQMYQVDIVKKAPKWTCKLCGEKQSLKKVFCQGSGKECRLQVQRLNELKALTEQNHSSGDVSPLVDRRLSGELDPPEEIKTQTNWSEFVDEQEDDAYDEIFNSATIEYTDQTEGYSQENSKPQVQQHEFVELIRLSVGDDNLSPCHGIVPTKRNEKSSKCFSENDDVPATKVRKIETNSTTQQSEWDQYLPDELSD
ncbi:MRN complex-interacting protein [Bradysia coprophila]|uniref:MRN complex-interacting protein n=1 Tax=Bradysia coprophila TaxID=38358 RepID=UPI00187D6F7B|nr:MRN complex-interacting protein [Bradysia coprophila]